MNSSKATIAIIVSILGLIIGYFAITRGLVTKPENDSKGNINILKINKGLKSIKIEVREEQFSFEKTNKVWKVVKPRNFEMDKAVVEKIESSVLNLNAFKTEDSTKDYNTTGLSRPVKITVTTNDNQSYSIEVGERTLDKKGFYVKKKDDNTIYIVKADVGEILKTDRDILRNKKVLTGNASDMETFTLKQKNTALYTIKRDSKDWRIVVPNISYNLKADTNTANSIVNAIMNLHVSGFEKEVDPEKFGFSIPKYVLTFKSKGVDRSLLVGGDGVDGAVYCKFSDQKEIFTLESDSLMFLEKTASDIISKSVYEYGANDVLDASVFTGGTSVKLAVTGDVGTVDGVAVKKGSKGQERFNSYLKKVNSISINELDGANPMIDPDDIVATITYTLKKSQTTVTYTYTKDTANTYYVFKDGKFMGVNISKKLIDELATEGKTLKSTMN